MKVGFIGGGSYSWGPRLLGDPALSSTLAGQVRLMDIDRIAGERLRLLGEHNMAQQTSPIEVTYMSSLAAALEGADYVIGSITTGGLEATCGDLELPESYGIYQAVGDTVGVVCGKVIVPPEIP